MDSPARARTVASSLSWDDCRLLVESVSDYAIFMLERDGRIATWNRGAERIKGYTAREIVGRHFSTFYTTEDVAAGQPEEALKAAEAHGRFETEGWRVRKDGTRFRAHVTLTALREPGGTLRGFGKVTRDLTARWAAEEQLRRSEERFRLLVESVADHAIYALSPEGEVTTWNVGAERLKGFRAEEIIGRHFSVFFPDEDVRAGKPARELVMAAAEGRFEDEGWRVRKDGSRFWANVIVTPLYDLTGKLVGYSKITRDLTARQEADRAQRRLLAEQMARAIAEGIALKAEEANRIKDEFLATVSHELRTPLNAIVGWTGLLRQRALEPGVAKGIEVIERNAQAQVKIIEDLLDVSRIVSGKLRIEPKPMDLVAVTREAIEVMRPSAAGKDVTIVFRDRPDACLLRGDTERLRQVAWNLLSNAVKFADPGGTVTIAIREEAPHAVLRVTDDGRGIDPDFLPYVFERFRQADQSTTRRFGGLGLGLALVRHIVELHGGTVAAESEGLGRGASFVVRLPLRGREVPAPPAAPVAMDAGRRARHVPELVQGLRLLVVDDDADTREILAAYLIEAGAVVETARSVGEAIAAIRRFRPHVILSDIGMPDEDGYSLIRRVRALDPADGGAVPAIALTAYTRSEDRTKALAAGFTTHIGKPVDLDDLLAAVANLAMFVRR